MKIYKIYFFSLIMYLLPVISLGIFIIDGITVGKTGAVFWGLFLMSLLPCGLIGITLSSIGLIKSSKNKNQYNRNIGKIGIFVGLFFLYGGILALGLLYVVLH